MDRSIKSVPQLPQVFESHRMMFKELKEKKKQLPLQCICKEKENTKNTNALFGERQ
jgi:hypothetical protein